jgi:hypothetical protein
MQCAQLSETRMLDTALSNSGPLFARLKHSPVHGVAYAWHAPWKLGSLHMRKPVLTTAAAGSVAF